MEQTQQTDQTDQTYSTQPTESTEAATPARMVTLTFDLDQVFTPEAVPLMARYFAGEITALEAATFLGWTRSEWERHMAGVFSLAVNEGTSVAHIAVTEVRTSPRLRPRRERKERKERPAETLAGSGQ